MDCGSFVYGFTTKCQLSILDHFQSTGIHLATGSFCTCPLESTFGILRTFTLFSLSLWRILLLYTYVAKLSIQPHHPSFSAGYYLIHCSRYELNIRAPQPVGVCFHHLPELIDFACQIIPSRLACIPPSSVTPPTCNFLFIPYFIQPFSKLTSYPYYVMVYLWGWRWFRSYRLFGQWTADFAFIYEEQVFSYHLNSFNIIYMAELYTIYWPLIFISQFILPSLHRVSKYLAEYLKAHIGSSFYFLHSAASVPFSQDQDICCILLGNPGLSQIEAAAAEEVGVLGNLTSGWALGDDVHAYLYRTVLSSWHDK